MFYDLTGAIHVACGWPAEDVIRGSRVLFVDHLGVERMIDAARVARGAGIGVVADFEADAGQPFQELVGLVDHLILSEDFAQAWTGCDNPSQAAQLLWKADRETVVVTCGRQGCWYIGRDAPGQPRFQPAFRVHEVDTTGCGDVFHGAYAAALARGWGLPSRIEYAAAVAALKATRSGGQTGIPTHATVESFLAERKSDGGGKTARRRTREHRHDGRQADGRPGAGLVRDSRCLIRIRIWSADGSGPKDCTTFCFTTC